MASVTVEYKNRLKEIFRKHNPSKVSNVDHLMSKYKGNEHDIYEKVCRKYGLNPEPEYYGPADGDEEPEVESDDPFASTEEEEEEKVVQKVVEKPKPVVAQRVAQRKPVAKPKPVTARTERPKKAAIRPKKVAERPKRANVNARNLRQRRKKGMEDVKNQSDEEEEVLDDAAAESKEEEKKQEMVKYPPPNAWVLLFRQTSTEKGGGPWEKHSDTVNEDDLTNPMYANFKLLEGDYFRNKKSAFLFKLTWPSAPVEITPREMTWQQSSHPFSEEVEGFNSVSGELEGFEGAYRSEECSSLFQCGDCGLKIGLEEEHSDGVSKRGIMAPDKAMAFVAEMYVAIPAIARYPLANDCRDLECENDGELVGGAEIKLGSLVINKNGFFKVRNCDMFKAHKMKKNFTVCLWIQQLKTQECAHILSKGPWRKGFSISIRHNKGEGNQTRFSVCGSQGQKVVNFISKTWDLFPQLADKELQKLALEEEDKTWYHFAMTLGESTFTAYVNGKVVGEHKFHGNSILRNHDLKLGAGGSGSDGESPLIGRLFDLLLFDRALAPSAIQNIYECGLKRAADVDRREIQAQKDAEEALARKRAQPTDQYRKMMARMKMRQR